MNQKNHDVISCLGRATEDIRHDECDSFVRHPAELPSARAAMSIAGHFSQHMLAHYSHVRVEAKRKALDALV